MKPKYNLRKTGIDVIGDVPWGTHFCQFYETKQDLLDVLVPYFKEGLESNELCVWVTSEFLTTEEAKQAMQKSVPGFSKYLKTGQIEIFPHTEWYLKGGIFEMKRVLSDWVKKHDKSLKNGFDGTRVSGNPFWIDSKKDWDDFAAYEAEINKVIDNYKLVVLCTYSLKKCDFSEVIDVISNHEFALIKRKGKWENIESATHNKMEEALRRSESRYRSYIELTDQLAWTTNAKGEVEEDIPAWRKFTGQTYEETKGAGWSKALHPDDLKSTIKIWNKAVATKTPYEIEYRVRRFDGVYRHLLVRGVPVFKEDGSIREWIGTCIDITGRKKTEAELAIHAVQLESLNRSLQEESVRKDALLESIGDGVIALDKKKKIISLNRNTEPIFGWKTEDVLGKPLFSLFKLADKKGKIVPKELRPPQLALSTGQIIRGVYLLIKDQQTRLPLQITSAPVVLNKEIVGVITIYKDVSQQIAIDRAKDEFISIASHELRTPLSAIAWATERLFESDFEKYSHIQKKSLNQIKELTQRTIKSTNDLLDLTRMEMGVFSYEYDQVNPINIASNVIAELKEKIINKKIKFRFSYDKDTSIYRTYSNAIKFIFHNLLSNAVKFTPNGGKIDLKISNKINHLKVSVSDSGLGIPKSAQDKIFQKAFRANNVKGKFEGSGFGLYITKATVDRLGGKIAVRSAKNKGTVFTVILPLVEEVKESKPENFGNAIMGQISNL